MTKINKIIPIIWIFGLLLILGCEEKSTTSSKTIAPLPSTIKESEQSQPKITSEQISTQIQNQTSYIGLWKAEKVFGYNPSTRDFQEDSLNFDVYMEYTPYGKWCSAWESNKPTCLKYETYTIDNDIITQSQEGLTGPPFRYKWKLVGNKLELIAEIFQNDVWIPFLKYSLVSTQRTEAAKPLQEQAVSQSSLSATPPTVVSIEIIKRINSQTGNREVEIRCQAKDDKALERLYIGVIRPDFSSNMIFWQSAKTSDTNITDQIWYDVFDTQVEGTYTAVCDAKDKDNYSSERVTKPFTVP